MTYRELILSHGPSNFWSLNESSGLTAADSAGSAPGTISGGVTLAQPGALADGTTAMAFNGTTGKVQTAGSVTLPLVCTVECWLKTTTLAFQAMLSTRTLSTGDTLYVGMTDTGVVRVYVGGAAISGVVVVTTGAWRHVVLVVDGVNGTWYVDGAVDNGVQALARATPSVGPTGIGFDASSSLYWNGSLDEVAIYPRALTATEISDHYAARLTVSVPSAGCDHTTVWSKHLATLSAPTVESERAYLANLYGEPGGTDFSTLVSRWLQAMTCGTAVATPAAPTLSTVSPNTGTQGSMVTVTLTGTNFVTSATGVTLSGTGVSVVNIQVLSPTSLTADIAIAALATAGARALTVSTAGGASTSQPFTVASAVLSTSYSNPGGTGDRRASITVTSAGLGGDITGAFLVNGNTTEDLGWFGGNTRIEFTFLTARIIDEAKFYQADATTHGVWKWQGSNDGTLWTDLGGTFTLGGSALQTQTTLAGNTTAYLRYRLENVSGATSAGPYVREFEFKIA